MWDFNLINQRVIEQRFITATVSVADEPFAITVNARTHNKNNKNI